MNCVIARRNGAAADAAAPNPRETPRPVLEGAMWKSTETMLEKIERGEQKVSVRNILKLAAALRVKPGRLLDRI
jgi:transcriptional regulator with XRE-family HTH domain